jgi:hypothetical protein
MISQSRATVCKIESVPRSFEMTYGYVRSMNEDFPASELATQMDGGAGRDLPAQCPNTRTPSSSSSA